MKWRDLAGPATMMRLPTQDTAAGLDVAFIGIPMDIGTSNRSGTRHGPRQIRDEVADAAPVQHGDRGCPV